MRSAFSPNIKERRDCSTAIFDGAGRMVVQSASIPVHLGAMPEAVDAVRERGAAPGEVWLVNDPYRGGTHLPDLTMISALPLEGGRRRLRGHPRPPRRRRRDGAGQHARGLARAPAGGPGDPAGAPRARRRAGVRRARPGPRQHAARRASARATCGPSSPPTAWPSGAWPRSPRATAPAGCARPSARCWTTPSAAPAPRSRRCRTAATRPAEALEGDGVTDDDLWIRVAVTIAGDGMTVDFTGTDPQGPGNCNCPPAVTRSAVYFVVRCVTDPDIPASAGAFAPGGGASRPRGPWSTPARRPPSPGATSRPRAASSTPSSRPWARRSTCPPRGRGR